MIVNSDVADTNSVPISTLPNGSPFVYGGELYETVYSAFLDHRDGIFYAVHVATGQVCRFGSDKLVVPVAVKVVPC